MHENSRFREVFLTEENFELHLEGCVAQAMKGNGMSKDRAKTVSVNVQEMATSQILM